MTVRNLGESFADYAAWASDPRPRIRLGLPFFDSSTHGGLARSEIAMLMAFSSVGKTWLGLHAIRTNWDVPTLFFSIEMNGRMAAARLAALDTPMTTAQIEFDYKEYSPEHGHPDYVQKLTDKYRHLIIDDTPGLKLKDADRAFETATEKMNGVPPRLVVFDYMGLISPAGLLSGAEKVEKVAVGLRDWTRIHDCSTVVLHQVGKGDSKESGAEPLSLDSGKYGGHEPMDYVLGAYAPRLRRGISTSEFLTVQDELFIQFLKSRGGMASPAGQKHRLDHRTGRITEWSALTPVYPNYRQEAFQ